MLGLDDSIAAFQIDRGNPERLHQIPFEAKLDFFFVAENQPAWPPSSRADRCERSAHCFV